MRQPRTCLAVVSLSLLAARLPLVAQSASELQPGTRVRVQAPGVVAGAYTGTVLAWRGDTLVLGSPASAPASVPVSRVTSLEVSRGTSRALGAISGLKWGTPIGLGLGLALLPSINSCRTCNKGEASSAVILYGVSGAIWGAGIGALIGKERWDRFELPPTGSSVISGGTRLPDATPRTPDARPDGAGREQGRLEAEKDRPDSATGKLPTHFEG